MFIHFYTVGITVLFSTVQMKSIGVQSIKRPCIVASS